MSADLGAYLRARLNPSGLPSPVFCRRSASGGFGRLELAEVFGQFGLVRGAEIGVAKGEFSDVLCRHVAGLRLLLCIDPWCAYRGNRRGGQQQVHEANMRIAVERLKAYPAAVICRTHSLDAAAGIEDGSLDFVYIDGNHDFDYVMQDVIVWARKVRAGGVVAGDDYYTFRYAGVIPAVNAYTAAHGITEWYITANQSRSWFWVKP